MGVVLWKTLLWWSFDKGCLGWNGGPSLHWFSPNTGVPKTNIMAYQFIIIVLSFFLVTLLLISLTNEKSKTQVLCSIHWSSFSIHYHNHCHYYHPTFQVGKLYIHIVHMTCYIYIYTLLYYYNIYIYICILFHQLSLIHIDPSFFWLGIPVWTNWTQIVRQDDLHVLEDTFDDQQPGNPRHLSGWLCRLCPFWVSLYRS
jgi:hypothetical protein